MILVIDNYDSFTYNLVHLLYSLHADVVVRRNREITVAAALDMRADGLLLSPGPGRPAGAGIMEELIRAAADEGMPMLGVCLGHQAIGEVFGAELVAAARIMHGKVSRISHNGEGLFTGLKNDFKAVRYHSLALQEATLPAVLEVTARADDGEIMGLRHRTLPIHGIQYHPESIMTTNGKQQLANFLKIVEDHKRKGA
ncbi:MAG: anthranilate synthase component II [Lentisphaeria bacterium]|jgi:anthranilate synthase component 2